MLWNRWQGMEWIGWRDSPEYATSGRSSKICDDWGCFMHNKSAEKRGVRIYRHKNGESDLSDLLQMSAVGITLLVKRGGIRMSSGAELRRDVEAMPSFEINEQMVKRIQNLPDREMDEDLVHEVARQMVQTIRQLVSENPSEVENGIRVVLDFNTSPIAGDYVGTTDIAERFGMSQQQVRRWCEEGRIIAEQTPGGTWRIPTSQFKGLGAMASQAKRKRKSFQSVAGAWKGHDELREELLAGREE